MRTQEQIRYQQASADVYRSWRICPSGRPSRFCACSCPGWADTGPGSPSDRSRPRTCGWSWSLRRLWPKTERVHGGPEEPLAFCGLELTPRTLSTMNSLTANSVTSNIVMTNSWTGLVFPRTAPNEMRTDPVQKSALIMLKRIKLRIQQRDDNRKLTSSVLVLDPTTPNRLLLRNPCWT